MTIIEAVVENIEDHVYARADSGRGDVEWIRRRAREIVVATLTEIIVREQWGEG